MCPFVLSFTASHARTVGPMALIKFDGKLLWLAASPASILWQQASMLIVLEGIVFSLQCILCLVLVLHTMHRALQQINHCRLFSWSALSGSIGPNDREYWPKWLRILAQMTGVIGPNERQPSLSCSIFTAIHFIIAMHESVSHVLLCIKHLTWHSKDVSSQVAICNSSWRGWCSDADILLTPRQRKIHGLFSSWSNQAEYSCISAAMLKYNVNCHHQMHWSLSRLYTLLNRCYTDTMSIVIMRCIDLNLDYTLSQIDVSHKYLSQRSGACILIRI